ncbi:major facilitator superfamily domain-containing protein 6-like [Porites lutea]|uniref:major facilitator superfamily domain-containing protein 6-like n=1 Tax=Porites lutea TaxID=51062 RepID=UPI003CC656AB
MTGSSSQDMAGKTNSVSKSFLQYKNCIFLSLFYLFFETCFSFKMFFMPVYWQQLGLSPTQIGILRAVWGVAYSVGAVLFGKLANKFRIRRALLLMSILSTMVTPLVSLLPRRTHDTCTVKWEQVSNAAFERQEKEVLRHRELQTKTNLNNFRKLLEEESHNSRQLISHGNHQLRIDFQQQTFKKIPRQLQENQEEVSVLEKSPKDITNIFIMFIFIVFIGELLSSPAFNLANSEIVEFLGENSREFGKIRLWGPIGHIIAAPITAYLVTHFHYMLCGEYQDNFAIAFVVIVLMAFGAFVSVTQFGTVQARDCKRNQKEDETPMTLTKFFAQYQNFIFITMTFLIGCFDGVVLTFGFWYTKTLDVSVATLVFGFSRMTCSAVSVLFLGAIGMCVKKTGYAGVVLFSMLLFVSWFVGMSFMKNPWFMLIFETIGYIAYVVGFTGLISYFGEVTPANLMDTVQGGVNSLFLGVGCGIGTALCGFSIDIFGAVKSFRFFAIGTSLLIVLFTISQIPTTMNFFRFSFKKERGEI